MICESVVIADNLLENMSEHFIGHVIFDLKWPWKVISSHSLKFTKLIMVELYIYTDIISSKFHGPYASVCS